MKQNQNENVPEISQEKLEQLDRALDALLELKRALGVRAGARTERFSGEK